MKLILWMGEVLRILLNKRGEVIERGLKNREKCAIYIAPSHVPFSPAEEKLSKHSLTTLFSLLFAHFWRKHKKVKAIIASSSVTFIPIKSEQLFRFPRKLRFFIELLKAIRRGLNTLLSSNYDKIFFFFSKKGGA